MMMIDEDYELKATISCTNRCDALSIEEKGLGSSLVVGGGDFKS